MWQWCCILCIDLEEDVCLVDGLFQLPVLTGVKCSKMTELSAAGDSEHDWISPVAPMAGQIPLQRAGIPLLPQKLRGLSP